MCKICKETEGLTREEALEFIASELENDNYFDHLSELLDRILSIQPTERIEELDALWENNRERP